MINQGKPIYKTIIFPGRYLQHLVSIMSPVYWTTATEVGEASNGWTLTEGKFRREVQVEFATGKVSYSLSINGLYVRCQDD